jgi:hypothetical protein
MAHRVCPWWLGYWLICPLRRRRQNPAEIVAPYVHEGSPQTAFSERNPNYDLAGRAALSRGSACVSCRLMDHGEGEGEATASGLSG